MLQIGIRHPILSANQWREASNLGVVEIFHQSLVGEGGGEGRKREVVGVPLGVGRDSGLAFSSLPGGGERPPAGWGAGDGGLDSSLTPRDSSGQGVGGPKKMAGSGGRETNIYEKNLYLYM